MWKEIWISFEKLNKNFLPVHFLADFSIVSSTLGKDLSLKLFGTVFTSLGIPKSWVWNTYWHKNQYFWDKYHDGCHIFRHFLTNFSIVSSAFGKDLSLKSFGTVCTSFRMPRSWVWITNWHEIQCFWDKYRDGRQIVDFSWPISSLFLPLLARIFL